MRTAGRREGRLEIERDRKQNYSVGEKQRERETDGKRKRHREQKRDREIVREKKGDRDTERMKGDEITYVGVVLSPIGLDS